MRRFVSALGRIYQLYQWTLFTGNHNLRFFYSIGIYKRNYIFQIAETKEPGIKSEGRIKTTFAAVDPAHLTGWELLFNSQATFLATLARSKNHFLLLLCLLYFLFLYFYFPSSLLILLVLNSLFLYAAYSSSASSSYWLVSGNICALQAIVYNTTLDSVCMYCTGIGRDVETELPGKMTLVWNAIRDAFLEMNSGRGAAAAGSTAAGSAAVQRTLLQLVELRAAKWQVHIIMCI